MTHFDSPTYAWLIPEDRIPADWAGRVYIEAHEDLPRATAYPVLDEPLRDRALFAFDCENGDTRLDTVMRNQVASLAFLCLKEIALSRQLVLLIETDCGDELRVAPVPITPVKASGQPGETEA